MTRPYCTTCGEWVGAEGLDGWSHYRVWDYKINARRSALTDHEVVIGWIEP